MTEVVNFLDVKGHWNSRAGTWDDKHFVYIGRANKAYGLPESPWANPYKLNRDTAAARAEAINQYRHWITTSIKGQALLEQLHTLEGKTLVCWCKDKAHPHRACHGDVLLELLGEQPVEVSRQFTQTNMTSGNPPILAWDKGGAAYESAKDKNNWYYRTNVKTLHPIGMPGKVYTTWAGWYRDYLKMALRVKGNAICSGMSQAEYARFRYETGLKAREGMTEERAQVECDILRELLAELDK